MPRKPHKYHYLYKTTNLINNKFYVGMHSTNKLDDGYLGSGVYLRRSIRKYGRENFKFEILEFFNSREILIEKETELVDTNFIHDLLCMNLRTGGTCAPESNYGSKRTDATKLKMSQWIRSKELGAKISAKLKGKQFRLGQTNSEEHNTKISLGKKGKAAHNKGKLMSEETKA